MDYCQGEVESSTELCFNEVLPRYSPSLSVLLSLSLSLSDCHFLLILEKILVSFLEFGRRPDEHTTVKDGMEHNCYDFFCTRY